MCTEHRVWHNLCLEIHGDNLYQKVSIPSTMLSFPMAVVLKTYDSVSDSNIPRLKNPLDFRALTYCDFVTCAHVQDGLTGNEFILPPEQPRKKKRNLGNSGF